MMGLDFDADARAAIDLAKRSLPKGGELDAGRTELKALAKAGRYQRDVY